jgi:hypothetical protein
MGDVPSHRPNPAIGGDRKAQAKGIRQAHGLHASYYRESVMIRSAAESQAARSRPARMRSLERDHVGRWPAMPSPGEAQANPTIAKALNASYDLLEVKCNRCRRVSLVSLRAIKRPATTPPLWKLEPALFCEPCSETRPGGRKQRAHVVKLTCANPEGEDARQKRTK